MRYVRVILFVLVGLLLLPVARSQEGTSTSKSDAEHQALFKKFEATLNNVALVGHFTVLGNDQKPLSEERYEIRGVKKLAQGDTWLFQARIKYGQHDVTLPLPLQVKWADKTPVITLDNVTIIGLGTFNARVIIDGDVYAGTWGHDKVRGHLFGRIEKLAEQADNSPPAAE